MYTIFELGDDAPSTSIVSFELYVSSLVLSSVSAKNGLIQKSTFLILMTRF